MKKVKSLLISLFSLFCLTSCVENTLLKDSTYINNKASSYGIYEVKFPSSSTVEFLGKGKYFFSDDKTKYWKKGIKFNKNNNNFSL